MHTHHFRRQDKQPMKMQISFNENIINILHGIWHIYWTIDDRNIFNYLHLTQGLNNTKNSSEDFLTFYDTTLEQQTIKPWSQLSYNYPKSVGRHPETDYFTPKIQEVDTNVFTIFILMFVSYIQSIQLLVWSYKWYGMYVLSYVIRRGHNLKYYKKNLNIIYNITRLTLMVIIKSFLSIYLK